MTIKKTLTNIALAGTLALSVAGCADKTKIKKVADLTGDGIQDILMYEDRFLASERGNFLFIGKEDGTFVRARETTHESVTYFLSNDCKVYFFDGKYYKESPKQK